MSLINTHSSYGAVTKTFHWLTALLIFSAIPLGLVASDLADQISDPSVTASTAMLNRATLLFSLHKTIGVTVFLVALARIAWAMSQPKPGLLNGDNPAESWAAETVHWLLYGSLVAVPLSGWVHHAATTGFAPIWWPFGQDLVFVPKSTFVAETATTLHFILQWVLIAAIALHIAGAFKHHVLDGDATLRRMLPGRVEARPTSQQPGHVLPFFTALAIWAAALGSGAGLGWFSHQPQIAETPAKLAEVHSGWQVVDGTLDIAVQQMGATVTGSFADWTAAITYDETPDDAGRQGNVSVIVSIASLNIGTVTAQALGPDYFAAQDFATATFSGDLISDAGGHTAIGTLAIRDQTIPVEFPFTLSIEGQTAQASGSLSVDRRAFEIGKGMTDQNSLGFEVQINFDLTAQRQ